MLGSQSLALSEGSRDRWASRRLISDNITPLVPFVNRHLRPSGSHFRDRMPYLRHNLPIDAGCGGSIWSHFMSAVMADSEDGARLRQRFGDILGHEGLVTRLGAALGPNLAAGRKKVTRWFSGEREPPEEVWLLLRLLEQTPKVYWPEEWKRAVLREVKVGRPHKE